MSQPPNASSSSVSPAEDVARRAKIAFEEAQKRLPGGKEADAARARALNKIRTSLEAAKDEVRTANAQDMEVSETYSEDITEGDIS